MVNYQKSDHYDGERFFNPWGVNANKSLWDVVKWKWTTKKKEWQERPLKDRAPLPLPQGLELIVSWVNHSTFLIRSSSLAILTDPVWGERASPVGFAGPKRVTPPGISWEDLPRIDVVVVSHNHYDHLDFSTLEKLDRRDQPLFLVPKGDAGWLLKRGLSRVVEKDWWEETIYQGARFTFMPAQHWSARTPWDRNESLWGAWGIEVNEKKIYHAGDTGHGPHFMETKKRWGKPALALLPIGAYEPRWFMKDMHMNPADTVKAMIELEAEHVIGMHYGTFQLTDEGQDDPLIHLESALSQWPALKSKVITLNFGASFRLGVP